MSEAVRELLTLEGFDQAPGSNSYFELPDHIPMENIEQPKKIQVSNILPYMSKPVAPPFEPERQEKTQEMRKSMSNSAEEGVYVVRFQIQICIIRLFRKKNRRPVRTRIRNGNSPSPGFKSQSRSAAENQNKSNLKAVQVSEYVSYFRCLI